MRIITHNMLKCNVRGVVSGYPLVIEPEKVEDIPCEFNRELVAKILGKAQLPALRSAAKNLGVTGKWTASEDVTVEAIIADEEMLQELHHFLFELHVLEGQLVCPESGRRFPIKDGIPNMLLHEDEV